ncbi:hypothetical protein [Blastopirellula marina]|uniref:LysM domain-containing protein n=1 Tax=Blastopirellula marina TaxID=124 RepID=A0A2S8G1M2_9BACT|nr:hypothetical protein [Blastopirellula marina]PQO38342.1 hypothetical protein C5Y98_09760 [Blastopirellula marina]PTL44998.1 hypothetical protein C5Y97_09765 [Blastopirellula marina]
MSVFRNLLIVGLLVCVAYNGYVIYRNQMVTSPPTDQPEVAEAPLFNAEAFTELAANRSQANIELPPTVVTPEPKAERSAPVANPVLEAAAEVEAAPSMSPTDVAPTSTVLAEMPLEPKKTSRFSEPTTVDVEKPVVTQPVSPTPSTAVTPKVLAFDDFIAKIAELEAAFQWKEALQEIDKVSRSWGYTEEQLQQIRDKGDFLAKAVVYAPNKHLAEPPLTFRPGMSLEQIAQEHRLPLRFLRLINGWTDTTGPTPGDSIKVLQGPILMAVDLKAKEIRLRVGDLYAGHMPIGQFEVTDSGANVITTTADDNKMQMGPVALVKDTEGLIPAPNSVLIAETDWQLIQSLTDVTLNLNWFPAASPEPQAPEPEAIAQTNPPLEEERLEFIPDKPLAEPQISVHPVDALKLQVYTPTEKAIQGTPVNYGIEVTNLSDQETDLVQIVVNMSEGIEPLKLDGHPGKIGVGQAMFDPLTIEPGKSIRLTVTIDTRQVGRFVVRPEVHCAQPATKYATEIQLRVANADSITAQAAPQDSQLPHSQRAVAETPQNPAQVVR